MLDAIVKLYSGGTVFLLSPAGKCLDNSLKEVIASFYHILRNYAALVRLVTYAAGNTTLNNEDTNTLLFSRRRLGCESE